MTSPPTLLLPVITTTPMLSKHATPDQSPSSLLTSSLTESKTLQLGDRTYHGKNMAIKFEFFNRLDIGARLMSSLPESDIKNMSILFEAERRESFDEEDLVTESLVIKKSYSTVEGDFSLNFFERTDSEVRQAYLNKLISMKILKLNPSKKHQEIIIFDWDDTLICTSQLTKLGLAQVSDEMLEDLKVLDERVLNVLETSVSFGKTCIVTNAELGWVKYTGLKFLPKSYEFIQEKIEVISARSRYQIQFPGDNERWKVETFKDLSKAFDENVIANILSIGDSRAELEAAKCLGGLLSHSLVKTVKFKSGPGVRDLYKQINLLIDRFEQIITSKTSLTIRLEKKSSS